LEEIEEEGLGLQGGIDALPDAMKNKLKSAGVSQLFDV